MASLLLNLYYWKENIQVNLDALHAEILKRVSEKGIGTAGEPGKIQLKVTKEHGSKNMPYGIMGPGYTYLYRIPGTTIWRRVGVVAYGSYTQVVVTYKDLLSEQVPANDSRIVAQEEWLLYDHIIADAIEESLVAFGIK